MDQPAFCRSLTSVTEALWQRSFPVIWYPRWSVPSFLWAVLRQLRPKVAASQWMPCSALVIDVISLTARKDALLRGAAQWRDRNSSVRTAARESFRNGEWPPEVVETALEAVLRDADEQLVAWQASESGLTVLAILPGNVIGPTIATAYCAAAAGANLMLKSSSRELQLADIVAAQFEHLGPPVAGTLRPMRWSGGDADYEAKVFPLAQRIIVFGDDATIEDV